MCQESVFATLGINMSKASELQRHTSCRLCVQDSVFATVRIKVGVSVEQQRAYQLSVHFVDGLGGLFGGGELHKTHTAADACVGVPQHLA